jgi:hypothetical protein
MSAGRSATVVWLSPSARSFACLCEPCLEAARREGLMFSDALLGASVRGNLAPEAATMSVRCGAGHEIVLRRGDRPPGLAHHDDRQLQLS